jgi:Cu+-exporting ATPase
LKSYIPEEEFKAIVFSLEKYSNHPIAKTFVAQWKTDTVISWKKVDEIKGIGLKAENANGENYLLCSYKIAKPFTNEPGHSVYLLKNSEVLGWVDLEDEIREEAKSVVDYLHSKKIKTILLSGDSYAKCKVLADKLNIDIVHAEKTPEEKLTIIEEINKSSPVAMIGDGINDSPALAKATMPRWF